MNIKQEHNRKDAILFSVYSTKKYTLPSFPIASGIHFDHLVRVFSYKLLHCKIILHLLKDN